MTAPRRVREPDRLRDPETGEWDHAEVRHRVKGWLAVLVSLAVVVGGLWFGGSRLWDAWMTFRTQDDYIGTGVTDLEVEIPHGSSMSQIATILEDADVVKSADTFRRLASTRPEESAKVQAGKYRMRTQMSSLAAFEALRNPANLVRNMFQLREGQRLSEQLAALAEATGLPLAEFEAIVADPADLELPDWAEGRVDGLLFPDTYELPANPTAAGVMKMAVDNFKRKTQGIDFATAAEGSPSGNAYQALIMASLVEREANTDEDRAKAARVFYNRLAAGQKLESDATVAYANNITGRVTTTPEERLIDSPYNTYLDKNAGKLPPGPLTSPSLSALRAAVHPAEGNWMFFVVVNLDTGETVFSDTYDQHLRAVNQFRQFCETSDKC